MAYQHPIFILGTTRSGTSALHLSLMFALEHQGCGEGHFFETLEKIEKSVIECFAESNAADVQGTFIHKIGVDGVKNELYGLYQNIFYKYLGKSFIDKTPTFAAIRTAPLIQKVFPNAKIIYMQRRGIENVLSKRKKFPTQKFSDASNEWKECIGMWNLVKKSLSSFLEIEQYNLKLYPQKEVNRISEYLNLSLQEKNKMLNFLREKNIEKTSNLNAINFEDSPFTPQEKLIFMDICEETMKKEGYSFNQDYFA